MPPAKGFQTPGSVVEQRESVRKRSGGGQLIIWDEGSHLLLTRAHDGFEDLHVASAATKISGETVANIVFSWLGISFEQIDSGQHHAGSADTALRSAVVDERLLDRVQVVPCRQLPRW